MPARDTQSRIRKLETLDAYEADAAVYLDPKHRLKGSTNEQVPDNEDDMSGLPSVRI